MAVFRSFCRMFKAALFALVFFAPLNSFAYCLIETGAQGNCTASMVRIGGNIITGNSVYGEDYGCDDNSTMPNNFDHLLDDIDGWATSFDDGSSVTGLSTCKQDDVLTNYRKCYCKLMKYVYPNGEVQEIDEEPEFLTPIEEQELFESDLAAGKMIYVGKFQNTVNSEGKTVYNCNTSCSRFCAYVVKDIDSYQNATLEKDGNYTDVLSKMLCSNEIGHDMFCQDGYALKSIDLVNEIGVNPDFATAEATAWAAIDGNGNTNLSDNSLSSYGLTSADTNKFVVDYGSSGKISGRAMCSNVQGPDQLDPYGGFDLEDGGQKVSLPSDSGKYCWCNIDGYTPYNSGTKKDLSAAWIFDYGYDDTADCNDYCAANCAEIMRGIVELFDWEISAGYLGFREAMFNAVTGYCEVIPEDPGGGNGGGSGSGGLVVNYSVTLDKQGGNSGDSSVYVENGSAMPAITTPSRSGYIFGGYFSGTNGSGTQYYNASGTSVHNWDKTEGATLYAKWTAISCPGDQTWNTTTEQCELTCPSGYSNHDNNATLQTQCWKACTNSANATAMTGRDYYGNGGDTCKPSTCDAGYTLNDVTAIIGNDEAVGSAWINDNGFAEETDNSYYGQSFYGITSQNTWAAYYENKGILFGKGYCSTIQGDNDNWTYINTTTFNNLTDETGQEGAEYCYCNITGYKPNGGTLQTLSSPWRFEYKDDYASNCATDCAYNCATSAQYVSAGSHFPLLETIQSTCEVDCPNGYSNYDSALGKCYRACTVNDVDGATSVTGNVYSDGTKTCVPADANSCKTGYNYLPEVDLTSIISGGVGQEYAYINSSGEFVLSSDASGDYDQSFYGITGDNTWAVYYDDARGIVTGSAYCSTVVGYNQNFQYTNPTTHTTSELGDFGGQYCYCNVTGYKSFPNGSLRSLYSPWMFYSNRVVDISCIKGCTNLCAGAMRNPGAGSKLANALYETADPAPAICELETYTITYENVTGATHTNPDTYTVNDIPILLNNASKTGYTFNGWYTAETGGTRVTQITSDSLGDKTLWARWTANSIYLLYQYGSSIASDVSGSCTINQSFPLLTPSPTLRPGYRFTGWTYTKQ